MTDQQKSEVYPLTYETMKAHKKYFEAKECNIKEIISNKLDGELGIKSLASVTRELEETKKTTLNFFTLFKSNMETIEKKYKDIECLAGQLVEENYVFTTLQDEISQDELDASVLEEQIKLAQIKYKKNQENILTKKRKYHETYHHKLAEKMYN
jgi:hypothetical protein